MPHWSLDDIPWHEFDAAKVTPQLVPLVKAASMVEFNGHDYARYLCNVFHDDVEFQEVAKTWALEEVQHGAVLRRWAELVDPKFDFEKSFKLFTDSYKLPMDVNASVRGSRSGELIARCIVETGTSSYYTAMREATDEPVLRAICAKIAADELRHYKLFYTHLKTYMDKENLGFWGRLKIALGRIAESEDDELASAYYAAQHPNAEKSYNHTHYKNLYMAGAYFLYKKPHIERMVAMVFKAIGIKPHDRVQQFFASIAWNVMRFRASRLKRYRVAAIAA